MTWRAAPCILQMLDEANTIAPHRHKSSDGILGDAAHASRPSDHNPDSRGIVHAIDLTEDPPGGWDCAIETEKLRTKKDRRLKYVIFNHRWFHGADGATTGHTPWAWESYHGASPHTEHMHVSVRSGATYEDDVSAWWKENDDMAQADVDAIKADLAIVKESVGALYPNGPTLQKSLVKTIPDASGVKQPTEHLNRLDNMLTAIGVKLGITFKDDGTV